MKKAYHITILFFAALIFGGCLSVVRIPLCDIDTVFLPWDLYVRGKKEEK